MGQDSSSQVEKQNKNLQQHLKSMKIQNYKQFWFVNRKQDESIVLKNIQTQIFYVLRILAVTTQQDSIVLSKMIQKRNKISCLHLCKIITVKRQLQSHSCSQIYKINILLECPQKSIRKQFEERKQKLQRFQIRKNFHQAELWGMAYSLVKALKGLYLYGMVHQSLSLDSIYIDEKGLIKLADPALFGLQKNYITAMKQNQKCQKILSPQILIFLEEYNFYFYQKEKSDIFILGIMLLQLSTLNQFQIYDYRQKKTRLELIQINLNHIKNSYSFKFCTCLQWMTQIQPKKRPNSGELLEFIDKNNSQGSTSLTNTAYHTTNSVPTVLVDRNLNRQKTVSAFSVQSKYQYDNIPNLVSEKKYQKSIKHTPILDLSSENFISKSKQRNQTQQSKDIFPFELVYNRVINNNESMKKFQIQNLYKQYKNTDMFGSSCRGSIQSSSYHAKIQLSSKQVPNKNSKIHDVMVFSKKSQSKGQNLVYSHSSAFNLSNRLQFSKNSLGDIKLVESNHIKQFNEPKKFIRQQTQKHQALMSDIMEQNSVQSPYRKLGSLKSNEGKSLYSIHFMDIQPIVFKDNYNQIDKSGVLKKYQHQNDLKNNNSLMMQNQNIQIKYHSQQKHKNSNVNQRTQNVKFQSYLSDIIQNQNQISQKNALNQKKSIEDKLNSKYNRYLMIDKVICKQNGSSKQIQSSRNPSYQSSQLESKLSRATPNFAEKSKNQNSSKESKEFQKNSRRDDFIFLQDHELIFVQNEISQQGDKYTGYKNKLGLKQRHGKLVFNDGGYYEGQWKNGKMNGYGQMFYANGSLAYKGLWIQGCFNGNGQIFNDTPEYFEQQFNYLNFTQIGDKWVSYEGEFENDCKHGKGKISLTNGQFFEGTFDYDMIQGYGIFNNKHGKVIRGLWRDNQLVEEE